jgi:hypothetical protein
VLFDTYLCDSIPMRHVIARCASACQLIIMPDVQHLPPLQPAPAVVFTTWLVTHFTHLLNWGCVSCCRRVLPSRDPGRHPNESVIM